MTTYQIYELSARAVMSYATEQDGVYTFALNRSATEHCKVPGANHEQDSCAMFHQLMYQLHGKGWRERSDEKVTALSDVNRKDAAGPPGEGQRHVPPRGDHSGLRQRPTPLCGF